MHASWSGRGGQNEVTVGELRRVERALITYNCLMYMYINVHIDNYSFNKLYIKRSINIAILLLDIGAPVNVQFDERVIVYTCTRLHLMRLSVINTLPVLHTPQKP